MKRILDWATTIPFLIAFVGLLVIYDPILRISRLFGLRACAWAGGFLQKILTVVFRINGTRIKVQGKENIEPGEPYIIVANHQSMYELPVFGATMFTNLPGFISKIENGKYFPSVSYYLRRGPNTLIDRKDRKQSLAAIKAIAERAEKVRHSVVIFPEGTRSRDGGLKDFRVAGLKTLLAAAPHLPVVPVTIDGGWKIMRHNFFPVPFGQKLRFAIGTPIGRDRSADQIIADTQAAIAGQLEDWRRAGD